jgi:hypothetical protein
MKDEAEHDIYHLSSGNSSDTAKDIAAALFAQGGGRPPYFVPGLGDPFARLVDMLASSKQKNMATLVGSLLKVFWPYITYDTVFDNSRVVRELGEAPEPFVRYAAPLYRYAKRVGFAYPHEPLPPRRGGSKVNEAPASEASASEASASETSASEASASGPTGSLSV